MMLLTNGRGGGWDVTNMVSLVYVQGEPGRGVEGSECMVERKRKVKGEKKKYKWSGGKKRDEGSV